MLERGVAAIFGPASDSTGAHVQSISQTFHIPHIEARYDYTQVRVKIIKAKKG